ncbi:MAG: transposase family protein, partial [Acidimicrobiales bacterium]
MLGLEGFVLRAAVCCVPPWRSTASCGRWWRRRPPSSVATAARTRARSKGRATSEVRDMACGGRPVRLAWRKRRWRCPDPDCDTKTWTETTAAIAPG